MLKNRSNEKLLIRTWVEEEEERVWKKNLSQYLKMFFLVSMILISFFVFSKYLLM